MATENDATLFGAAPGPVSFVTSSVPSVHGFKLPPEIQISGLQLKTPLKQKQTTTHPSLVKPRAEEGGYEEKLTHAIINYR